ncbi:MAG: hypothetical protein HUK20_03790 [Fibrobacter sp.]|nr:hypothetical protein [Fibrobacter sp.]
MKGFSVLAKWADFGLENGQKKGKKRAKKRRQPFFGLPSLFLQHQARGPFQAT